MVTGCRATAFAHDVASGARVALAAVLCAADGMATASLAREIGVLEFLAYQPSVLPLLGSGRAAGCLYAVTPCTDGVSLADELTREGPLPADEALTQVIAVADLLHFMHGAGIAHGAVSATVLYRVGHTVLLGGFHGAVRLAGVPDPAACIAADVYALAQTACALLTAGVRTDVALISERTNAAVGATLHRATSRRLHERFPTAIALAQALHLARESMHDGACEVTARESADEAEPVLSDGVQRSLSVLHALLDRAEVDDAAPEPGDPLVQRCWDRASAQLPAHDARLVALRVRWRLLADRDPVGALSDAQPAQSAAAVWPYRARALAAMGQAAEARALAIRAWFDDAALDVPAVRSVAMALRVTRAFDLAALVSATESATGSTDPVLHSAGSAHPDSTVSLAAIAEALDRRAPWTVELLMDPRWDALRAEPGFATLAGRARALWTVP
jgi:hypothetical protein